jgi:hypothetical protein
MIGNLARLPAIQTNQARQDGPIAACLRLPLTLYRNSRASNT